MDEAPANVLLSLKWSRRLYIGAKVKGDSMDVRTKMLKKTADLLDSCRKQDLISAKARQGLVDLVEQTVKETFSKGFLSKRDVSLFREYALMFTEEGTMENLARLKTLIEYWRCYPVLQPVRHAAGVGPAREKVLQDIGIESIGDLLTYFPRRYEDRSRMKPIGALQDGEIATVRGVVEQVTEQKLKRGRLRLLKVAVGNGDKIQP